MATCAFAEKSIYIPYEWRTNSSNYLENDPNNQALYSKSRSMETDNFIIFWDKGWGSTRPDQLPSSNFYYFNLTDLKNKLEGFYKDEVEKLGFGDNPNSNIHKYKIIVCLLHQEEWACYGSGYDFAVPALWINPSTSKPVGSAVAHEVGHSFHYMCYSDASKQGTLSNVWTGFHGAIGSGATIWETTANWQALCSYPNEIFSESGTYYHFSTTHNYAFTHEWHRYQAYMFLFYLCEKYGDLKTVYQVWSHPETVSKDFNEVLMDLKGLTVDELYKLHFEFAMHAVTYDMEKCKPYLNNAFIGNFRYAATMIADSTYQVAYSSCPQGTGFNVIPLETKPAGTVVTTDFTAMRPLSYLTDADPVEYHNGDNIVSISRKQYNGQGGTSNRGFRIGYVVLKNDGSREYFAKDTIYGTGTGIKTSQISFTVPDNTKQMWLVVAPSLKNYVQHRWDDNIQNDDQWPYYFKLNGTDIGSNATVYVKSTIDGRDVSNVEFEYDVYFPRTTGSDHSGTDFYLSGKVISMLGTAFQMEKPTTDIPACLKPYSSGLNEGECKFYAMNPVSGNIVSAGYTTNGSGHWFNAQGMRCEYANGYVYSDFIPNLMAFTIGQYPGKSSNGSEYRIGQCLRYKKNGKVAKATFFFNIHITNSQTGVVLKSINYDDPTVTGIENIQWEQNETTGVTDVYNVNGVRIRSNVPASDATQGLAPGIYVVGKKKVMVR